MAKKEWREVPVEELSEEDVRRWFCRLRELYREERHRVHDKKVEIWQLKEQITQLNREKKSLLKEIHTLKQENEKKDSRTREQKRADFKKSFFDSL